MRAPTVFVKAIPETFRSFVTWETGFCLSSDVGFPILLAHSLEVAIPILNSMIHDDADFLSCRAFFRRSLLCYCRLFVSDYAFSSFSHQLVVIGSGLKRRCWQLLFPSNICFGDEVRIFDPGIFGDWIYNKGELTTVFMQTPVHNIVARQGQRIWWRVIMLCLILCISYGKLLLCISASIKVFGRLSGVRVSLGGCLSGTRFTRWYSTLVLADDAIRMRIRISNQQQVWASITIIHNYISFFRRVPKSMVLRCNGWIADFVFRKRKRGFIDKEKMFPKLESHTRLMDKTKATKHMIQIAAPKLFCLFVTRICYCNSSLMLNIVIFDSQ